MIKYLEHDVTFREVPDEVTLCINITNCPYHCPGCHSPQLWEDTGIPLNLDSLHKLIDPIKAGISCICFMGGTTEDINYLALLIRTVFFKRVAWYTGASEIPSNIDLTRFDYIKIGPYKQDLGGLDNPNTNQRLYKVIEGHAIDITNKFWNK